MSSALQLYKVSQAWRVAVLGAGAALPAAAVLNWLPNSEATASGAVMTVGAMLAGALAVTRSVDASAAGLRAGVLAAVVEVAIFVATTGTTVTWSANRLLFFAVAGVGLLCLSPVFGWVFGRVGGRVASAVATR